MLSYTKFSMEVNKKVAEVWPLLAKLTQDFPELRFVLGRKFMFRPTRTIVIEKTIFEQKNESGRAGKKVDDLCKNEQIFYDLRLLHEVGHALLEHKNCSNELDRIKKERSAWEKAQALSYIYNIAYDKEFVEAELDSYRDWLEQKTRCPECGMVRCRDHKGCLRCPICEMF